MTVAATSAPQSKITEQNAVLDSSHRCDAAGCGAQAYTSVMFPVGELDFCAHHFNKYEEKLRDSSIAILDERERLAA